MRSILITIPLNTRLNLGPLGSYPVMGWGLVLAAWCLLGAFWAWNWYRITPADKRRHWPLGDAMIWFLIAAAIEAAPRLLDHINIYGYGAMLLAGFATAAWVAGRRLKNLGYNGDLAIDAAMWILMSGIVGARLFFIVQYHERFFVPGRGVKEVLVSLVNLPDGGLVFYGGMISGGLAYWLFCRMRGLEALALADILITSVLIGMAFGRVGCLLNGCCYGDVSTLPWAITFPRDSVPYNVEIARGLIASDAPFSLPLHPTQIYSSLSSLLLALVTWAYYPFRRTNGEVLAIGWVCYPVTRFIVEFLRGDEPGRFGTPLTIGQIVSLGLIVTGMAFYWYIHRANARLTALNSPCRTTTAR